MKRIFTFALLVLFLTQATAQIAELKQWTASQQQDIYSQKFANRKLNKEQCAQAADIIDSLWIASARKRLQTNWEKLTFRNDSLKLSCACRIFGMLPNDGRSLYISLHGGGECPKEVNDEQWMNQIYLYEPTEGVYIAPRAPWNTWDLWHREGLDRMLEELIQACVVFEGVNPNKVYLMGYSAGGDGVWRLAPRMADKWAAVSMMAGHPGETSQVNLMNLPYSIWMGSEDAAYNRNTLAAEKAAILDSLAAAHPGKYIHQTNILQGKGHWMDREDAAALPWMAQYRRNPYPKHIVWRQEKVTREHFYWLSVPTNEAAQGKRVEARIEGNTIHIEHCDYSKLTIYLNDYMVNLDKKVTIMYKGKKIKSKKLQRTIANMYRSLNERNDRSYAFPAYIEVKL